MSTTSSKWKIEVMSWSQVYRMWNDIALPWCHDQTLHFLFVFPIFENIFEQNKSRKRDNLYNLDVISICT